MRKEMAELIDLDSHIYSRNEKRTRKCTNHFYWVWD